MTSPHTRLSMVAKHLASRPFSTSALPIYRHRGDYKYFLPIQTRWTDNDQYGHINNAIYYQYIDTVVNEYLIRHGALGTRKSAPTQPIGLVVSSNATFYAPASYPSVMEAGLAVTKMGRSSATYRVGIFEGKEPLACVVGGFTHVFVDPVERRPVKKLPSSLTKGIEPILHRVD